MNRLSQEGGRVSQGVSILVFCRKASQRVGGFHRGGTRCGATGVRNDRGWLDARKIPGSGDPLPTTMLICILPAILAPGGHAWPPREPTCTRAGTTTIILYFLAIRL